VSLHYKVGFAMLALLAGYALWLGALRDLPLFQVQRVSVVGLTGSAAPQVQSALELTAREMTTTDFSTARLRAAVSGYASIASLSARTEFPHGVRIDVVEHRPLARLDVNRTIVAVSSDDRVLDGVAPVRSLPLIRSSVAPSAGRVTDSLTRAELAVLAAAPRPLLHDVYSISKSSEGLTVRLRQGPLIYFGDATLPHAKWDSAAVVLASVTSRGAQYVDVSLPERPAAAVGDSQTSSETAGAGASTSAATLGGGISSSTSG
jgi:cell division protein FtsQ